MGRKNIPTKHRRKEGIRGEPKFQKIKEGKFIQAARNIVKECGKRDKHGH